MSTRRSIRNSWELPEPKRLARSSSPTAKTRKENLGSTSVLAVDELSEVLSQASQHDVLSARIRSSAKDPDLKSEDKAGRSKRYIDRLSPIKVLEELEALRGRTSKRHDEEDTASAELPSTGNSPIESHEVPGDQPERRVHCDENPIRSISLPPEVEHSSPTEPITGNKISILEELNAEKAERDFLHSRDFPIQFLRPVPNLNQMMIQITPVMGDPGTGFTKFGPKSPQESVFIEKVNKIEDEDPLSQGFLKDRYITSHRPDRLPWTTRTGQKIPVRGQRPEIRLPTAAEMRHDKAVAKKWSGRKYSINPNLKTRHLEFDVLKRKINHHELLSLDLGVDARRDALKIGGGEGDVGGSIHDHNKDSSRSRDNARQSSISTSTISSGRTSTFAAKSKIPKQETVFPQPLCCKPGCVHCQHKVPQAHARQVRSHDKKVEHGDMISVGGWDTRERRMRAQDIDRSLDTGRYGFGGAMLWRLVRVAARVEVNGESKDQHAWYVMPDRALGGFF